MIKKKCIITGSGSNLGKELIKFFKKKNWHVIELSSNSKNKNYLFNLNNVNKLKINSIYNADLLIHCAYDFKLKDWNDILRINVKGTLDFFKICKICNVKKIIHISSLSSYEKTHSLYGMAKFLIEKKSKKFNCINIRCGLFINNNSRIILKLKKITEKLFFIPLIGDDSFKLHICNYQSLCSEIYNIQKERFFKKVYFSGSKKNYTLKNIFGIISNKKKIYIKIPLFLIKFILNLKKILGLNSGFTIDNLLGLIHYNRKIKFEIKNNHKF